MKIFLLGTNITTGGAQKVLLDLADWLYGQGVDVTAAFFYDRDNLYEEWKSQHPFSLICLDAWENSNNLFQKALKLTKGWFKLLNILKQGTYTGILTFTHDSNILGLPAAWFAKVPLRYGSHHVRYPSLSRFKIFLHKWIINSRIATGLIAVSCFTKDQAIVDLDRVIAVGELRSAIKTKLKIAFEETEPNELNPYGLVLSLAEVQTTTEVKK